MSFSSSANMNEKKKSEVQAVNPELIDGKTRKGNPTTTNDHAVKR